MPTVPQPCSNHVATMIQHSESLGNHVDAQVTVSLRSNSIKMKAPASGTQTVTEQKSDSGSEYCCYEVMQNVRMRAQAKGNMMASDIQHKIIS